MSEQQNRPVGDGRPEGDAPQAAEGTFDESAAEVETDSDIAETSAEDLLDLLEKARAKADCVLRSSQSEAGFFAFRGRRPGQKRDGNDLFLGTQNLNKKKNLDYKI